jgi:NADH:ubiquinone oxidoreductase subunit 3 (subunit A)
MTTQKLSEQFNDILTQYQGLYQEYISVVNSPDNTYMVVPNTLFVGQNKIQSISNMTVEKCISACTTNASVSGASFDTNTGNCILSSGNGNLVNDTTSASIVPKSVFYSYQLQQLNSQLLSINKQMMSNAQTNQSNYQLSRLQNVEQDQLLHRNYQTLTQQRREISRMLKSYENADAAYEDGNINVTANYYTYIVLLFVTILLAFLLVKFSVTGKQSGGGSNFKTEALFLLGIMVVFLALSKILNNLHSFNFIAILLFAYLVAKIKLNQIN